MGDLIVQWSLTIKPDDRVMIAMSEIAEENYDLGLTLSKQALEIAHAIGNVPMIHTALTTAAKVLARSGQPERAGQLVGVVEDMGENTGIKLQLSAVPEFETRMDLVRQQLAYQTLSTSRHEALVLICNFGISELAVLATDAHDSLVANGFLYHSR